MAASFNAVLSVMTTTLFILTIITECTKIQFNDFRVVEISVKNIDVSKTLGYPILVFISHSRSFKNEKVVLINNKFIYKFPLHVNYFNLSTIINNKDNKFYNVPLSSKYGSIYTKKTFYVNDTSFDVDNVISDDSATKNALLYSMFAVVTVTMLITIGIGVSSCYYHGVVVDSNDSNDNSDSIDSCETYNVLKVLQLRTLQHVNTYKDRSVELDDNLSLARSKFEEVLIDKSFCRDDNDVLLLATRVLEEDAKTM